MAFDAAERNEKFSPMQCQRNEEGSSRGKRRVFLCRRTVRVKAKNKVISASFQKIEGGRLLGLKTRERGMVVKIGRSSEPRS